MDPAAAMPLLPHYVVRLSGELAALLSGAEGAEIHEGTELSEDELVDGLTAAGLIITYPSPPTAQHPAPAAHAATAATQPPAAAAANAADAERGPARHVVRLAGAIAALLGRAEGAEVTEDEAGGLLRTSTRQTLNLLLLREEQRDASACTRRNHAFALAPVLLLLLLLRPSVCRVSL